MSKPLALTLEFAAIASKASLAIMEVYETDFEVFEKDDHSPVTEADTRAEVIILEGLKQACPEIPVIAEEAMSRGEQPDIGETFILVDPLDGTREFKNRNGEFTVNIGLIENGSPIAGVVYAPAIKRLYVGDKTGGYFQELEPGEPISQDTLKPLKTRDYPKEGLIAIASRSHLDPETKAFLKKLKIHEKISAGSSLKFCRVAEGAADIYPRFAPTMEWDTAAGQAVLEAAGGQVLTPTGSKFHYRKLDKDFLNGHFIAWGGKALA